MDENTSEIDLDRPIEAIEAARGLVETLQPLDPTERLRAIWIALTALGDIPPGATVLTVEQATFKL